MNTTIPTIELTDEILRAANAAVSAAHEALAIANGTVHRVEALSDNPERTTIAHARMRIQAKYGQEFAQAALAAATIVFDMLCDAHDAAINAEVTA